MTSAESSLREMVDHWLRPDPSRGVRVIEFRNSRCRHECYVCVEAPKATGAIALFFFRHGDGAWRIFPQARERPAMRVL
ncbi:hypothetical protein PTKU46_78870 [Paraburkholderia terrae]|uniref:Uncharacterized protein n=1 Tax=Paraburkholderia hospita TaxID=169430 RepID=A0AAJ4T1T6_9BURK|nr:hypothetical protein [Paraburkholderia hospita]AUT76731.1 hypothetical protein C2L64_49275 [Paraburkholderia hospita]AXF06349.1 hypothetical protein CUJ88_45015 [Paraburkholderia hospita]SEI17788.1 hypothetical protein SAMN05192544_103039 [Paraburkholderia hospita]